MIGNVLPGNFQRRLPNSDPPNESESNKPEGVKRGIQQAQEIIFNSLLAIVKQWPSEEVLLEFKNLFIYHVNSFSSDVFSAVYEIIFSNNETEFINTLKRSCYILVNNWAISRNHQSIKELIQFFSEPVLQQKTQSPTLKRLRTWINHFVESEDFQELKLFISRYDDPGSVQGHWKHRYTAFLLAPQYANLENPVEQREAARILAKQLRERFKFDLAMYVTRSQSISFRTNLLTAEVTAEGVIATPSSKNPTALGDDALQLIKRILTRRGQFGYANLANIFVKQVRDMPYRKFKANLIGYLTFAVDNPKFVQTLRSKLSEKLVDLYTHHDDDVVTDALLLRTCNRVVEYLTTEDQEEPSALFALLLSQSNPLSLATVLLKLILVCRYTRPHLEARIAKLIQYYENLSERECQWIIHFLEVLNITFAIYAENVQYNLIKMSGEGGDDDSAAVYSQTIDEADEYRIFSQQKGARQPKPDPEAFPLDELSAPAKEAAMVNSATA